MNGYTDNISDKADFFASKVAKILLYIGFMSLEIFIALRIITWTYNNTPIWISNILFIEILGFAGLCFIAAILIFLFKFTFILVDKLIGWLIERGIIREW